MITQNERKIVEAVKSVPRLVIHFRDVTGSHNIEIKDKITKHDIAIALQSYFNGKH
jgi:hypothetical protein